MAESPESIAYTEAREALTAQRASLDELRSRAGLLLSAAAISGSFLGTQALEANDFGVLSGIALFGFLATLGATLLIFLPRRESWTFVRDAEIILEDWAGKTPREAQGFLARTLSEHYKENERLLEKLFRWFEVACAGLALQVGFWIIQLATA